MQPCADCINDASGVEPKAAPGGQDGQICGMSDGGIDAGEAGGREPPRRLSGGRCGRSRRAVVRSTLPEARAEVSALVRTRLHGAVWSEVRVRSAGAPARVQRAVRGEAGTRRGTRRNGPSRRRCPQPAQPARASEAQAATSAARSAGARRARRWSQRCRRTLRWRWRAGTRR